jgi:hypothetical protein
MSISRANFFPKLKSFAIDVENDVTKLKKQCNDKTSATTTDFSAHDVHQEEFVNRISSDIHQVKSKFQGLENSLFGSAASRLSYVTIDEVISMAWHRIPLLHSNDNLLHIV